MRLDAVDVEAALGRILPGTARVTVSPVEGATEGALFAEERQALDASRSVEMRRREFAAGRQAARAALAALGCPPVAIPVGEMRRPLWPAGHVGSISHAGGLAAAAAAKAGEVAALGIDIELAGSSPLEAEGLIQLPEEAAARPAAISPALWLLLHFSMKESLFKCVYPLRGTPLDFLDVALHRRPDGRFRAMAAAGATDGLVGRATMRWAAAGSYVVSCAWIAPRRAPTS
jgi:4'-phosphopantetheinyl transferase EntD